MEKTLIGLKAPKFQQFLPAKHQLFVGSSLHIQNNHRETPCLIFDFCFQFCYGQGAPGR